MVLSSGQGHFPAIIRIDLQRAATAELLSDAGAPLARTLPLALVNGGSTRDPPTERNHPAM